MNGKPVDPTPAQFDSYEAAAEFWDTHDTTDYPGEFRTVEVTKEASMTKEEILREISSLPPEGQRLVENFLASLRQRYSRSQPATQSASGGIQNESFIGMWRDHDEMQDSSDWVRKLRKSEWGV